MKKLILSIASILLASTAAAKDMTYVCQLDVPTSQRWVPAQIAIFHTTGSKTALVNDPLISHFLKKPANAKVAADNDQRVTFAWELPQVRNSAGQVTPRFLYRASYYKKTGKVNVSATPAGYRNNFNAYGKCSLK